MTGYSHRCVPPYNLVTASGCYPSDVEGKKHDTTRRQPPYKGGYYLLCRVWLIVFLSLPLSTSPPTPIRNSQGSIWASKLPVKQADPWADPRTGVVSRDGSLGKMSQRRRRDTGMPLQELSRDETRKVRLSKIHGANSKGRNERKVQESQGN